MGERIYCHPQTDCFVVSQLFSVARHVGRLKLGSKPTQLYVRLSIRPLAHIYIYIYIYIYQVVLTVWVPLTLLNHPFQSVISSVYTGLINMPLLAGQH